MARGKHGAIAERRKDDAEYAQELESYRRAIQRLTTEKDELKAKLDATQRSLGAEVKHLKARLDAGFHPELEVYERKLGELRRENTQLNQRLSTAILNWSSSVRYGMVCTLLALGCEENETLDWCIQWAPQVFDETSGTADRARMYGTNVNFRRLSPGAARRLAEDFPVRKPNLNDDFFEKYLEKCKWMESDPWSAAKP